MNSDPTPVGAPIEAGPRADLARRRRLRGALLAVLGLGLAWRITLAAVMPCLSRDGVTFCWFARDLGEQGLAFLRAEGTQQHPLFPALILLAQRTAVTLGAPATPLTWQVCGQLVAGLSGLAVMLLLIALTRRIGGIVAPQVEPGRAAMVAAALAASLPLNVLLSADVMSDQLHLALYLGALLLALDLSRVPRATLAGILAGLAYLTRPEGAAVLVAAAVAAWRQGWSRSGRAGLGTIAALLVGFALCAVPYGLASGRVFPKKNPFEAIFRTWSAESAYAAPRAPSAPAKESSGSLARLETEDYPVWRLLPEVLYKLMRAGRIVVPLLALVAVVALRSKLLVSALSGLTTAFALHLALNVVLLERWGYLDTRHTLVLAALLLPLAALTLAWWLQQPAITARPAARIGLWVLALAPLVFYALRIPNGEEFGLRRAADWLTQYERAGRARLFAGGSAQKRLAFYADLRWTYFLEDPRDHARVLRELVAQRPDYLALELGSGFEAQDNAALLAVLWSDERISGTLQRLAEFPRGTNRIHLFMLRWPEPP